MTPDTAKTLLSSFFAPAPAAHFFGDVVGRVVHHRALSNNGFRKGLLGIDPGATITSAGPRLRGRVRIAASTEQRSDPPDAIYADPVAFGGALQDALAAGLSLAISGASRVCSQLALVERALAHMVGGEVFVNLFWAPPGARTSAHWDDYDVLAVQVTGSKSWSISTEDAGYPNFWREISPGRGGLPPCRIEGLEDRPHTTFTLSEGEMLYIPRGQWHEVVTRDQESISLAFGFRSPSKREVLATMLDYLADRDRDFRAVVDRDVANGASPASSTIAMPFTQALMQAAAFFRDGETFHDAMLWRRASFVGSLPALEPAGGNVRAAVLSDRVRLADLAICFVSPNGPSVVLSYPGDHLTAPFALEPAFRFIAETDEFCVRELPGKITDGSKVKIVNQLIERGVLELSS